jgi:hypothetical protein
MSKCTKVSNNKYFDAPAIMNDARAFTDYTQNYIMNDNIRLNNKKYSDYEYRQYLIKNGNKLINEQHKINKLKNGYKSCKLHSVDVNEICTKNKEYSICNIKNINGIGIQNNTIELKKPKYNPIKQKQNIIEESAKPGLKCEVCVNYGPNNLRNSALN